jgi:hypothetical protein
MTRHPELAVLVHRLRQEHPRPKMRWSELLERVRRHGQASKSRTVRDFDV